ncbi:hypothetical protein BDR05DRAFT_946558 [Suillus weaverae]|nr:hypothetical protein BDR05DRAFT_946558 [Suillus weaverae]
MAIKWPVLPLHGQTTNCCGSGLKLDGKNAAFYWITALCYLTYHSFINVNVIYYATAHLAEFCAQGSHWRIGVSALCFDPKTWCKGTELRVLEQKHELVRHMNPHDHLAVCEQQWCWWLAGGVFPCETVLEHSNLIFVT